MINLIFASDRSGVIGVNNSIPWNIPYDLKRFRTLTLNSKVVMGRKTYESIPFYPKGFPSRENVIVSKTLKNIPGCLVVDSLEAYLDSVKPEDTVWIVGGSEIYKKALPYVDNIYHTEVEINVKGDTYFKIPEEEMDKFKLVYSVTSKNLQEIFMGETNLIMGPPFTINKYTRK